MGAKGIILAGQIPATLYTRAKFEEIRFKVGGEWQFLYAAKGKRKKLLLRAEDRAIFLTNQHNARFRISDELAHQVERLAEEFQELGLDFYDENKKLLAMLKAEQSKTPDNSPPVPQAVESFLAEKQKKNLSAYHLRDLKLHLGRFAQFYNGPVKQMTCADVRTWLASLKVGPRAWNNYRATLAQFFKFVGHTEAMKGIVAEELEDSSPYILTPAELEYLLRKANPVLRRCMAISAFAHLRSEEVWRLGRVGQWSIDWENNYIVLGKALVKGRRGKKKQRKVPMPPNLRAFLADCRGERVICPYKNAKVLAGMKWALATRLGLKWERNTLRKSSITYRLASGASIAVVASEAGNSPNVISDTYEGLHDSGRDPKRPDARPEPKLITAHQAEAWYRIYPPAREDEFSFVNDPAIRGKTVGEKIIAGDFLRNSA